MALYYNGNKIIGSDGTCSADKVSLDDTNLSYEADDVQEAFEKVTKSLTYDEYEALTDAEKNNGTIYLITDVNGDGQSFQPVIYSTEEREIGVWADGRPLYQKTFLLSTVVYLNQYEWINTGCVVLNADQIISSQFSAGVSEISAIADVRPNESYAVYAMNMRNTTVSLSKFTLRYTKTTDQPGSGTWTPQGVPAVHYSEDEQVIGTWVDGSTIYEKTVNIAQYSVTAVDTDWNNLFAIPNIEYLVSAEAHGNSPNIGQNLRFYANNGYIQIASKTSIDVSILGTYYFTFRYTKSST